MADLLELLRQSKERLAANQQQAMGDAQAGVAGPQGGGLRETQGLAAAIQNQPAPIGPGGGPRASNVGERMAQAEGQRTLQELGTEQAQQARAAETQMAGLEAQSRAARREENLTSLGLAEAFSAKEAALLERARQAKARGDQAELESIFDQAAFNRRLSNDTYLQTLQQEGTMSRLADESAFREALLRDVFQEELDVLQEFLDWKELQAMDDRALAERLMGIDIETAIAIASSRADQANMAAMASGASAVLSGGVQAATIKDSPTGQGTPEQREAIEKAKANGGTLPGRKGGV